MWGAPTPVLYLFVLLGVVFVYKKVFYACQWHQNHVSIKHGKITHIIVLEEMLGM